MSIATVVLLAALLCAEAPAGTLRERYYIAQTVVYRAKVSGQSVSYVVHQPKQYQGLSLIDWKLYRIYRMKEMETNAKIAAVVLLYSPTVEISNFCAIGSICRWESSCKLRVLGGGHKFYLCPEWEK